MKTLVSVKHNLYQDSLKLMKISNEILDLPGIGDAFAFMGTTMNKEVRVSQANIEKEDLQDAGPNDLILMVQGEDEEVLREGLLLFEKKMSEKAAKEQGDGLHHEEDHPKTISQGIQKQAASNLAIISIPGEYAALEAMKALQEHLHVHMFSDNVTIEEEILLKTTAKEKNVLFMGPDCGTSIINGTPICFANKIRKGPVGVVGASGTGIQQVTTIIDRIGSGISHAIGTGGRDLQDRVGGITALMGLEMLEKDEHTKVILLVSKPAGEKTKSKIIETMKRSQKQCVVVFLGDETQPESEASSNIHYASTLEEGAALAAALSDPARDDHPATAFDRGDMDLIVDEENRKKNAEQTYLRGLYTGGSLADETIQICTKHNKEIFSNLTAEKELQLPSIWSSYKNTIMDLGEDEFTKGKLHPMIDPTYRSQRLIEEMADPEVSVILCDVVIGYGAHENPAKAVADAVRRGRERGSHYVSVVASVCGTEKDPQILSEQERILKEAGVLVCPSNQYATEVAAKIAWGYKEEK